MKKENKKKRFELRLTELERLTLEKNAKKVGYENNISQYIIRRTLKKESFLVNPNKLIDELYLLRAELNKIGSNLNQVAHYTNSLVKNNIVDHKHIKELKEIELGIENKVYELKKTIDKTIDKTL